MYSYLSSAMYLVHIYCSLKQLISHATVVEGSIVSTDDWI